MVKVYALKCTVNGFAYVGSTRAKLGKRLREHRCLLNGHEHACAQLLADWHTYGESQFELLCLEELPTAALPPRREAELRWMDHYASLGLLYNEHRISMRPTEAARVLGVANSQLHPGRRWAAEANEKRSLAQLGIPKGHGAKISATKRAKRAMR